jgi:hypothetical protein
VLSAAPIYDSEGDWTTPEEAIGWRTEWFSSNFPPINTDYACAVSVSNLVSELAFSGICCLHTQTIESLPSSSIVRTMCKDKNATYVNDNTALGSYRVRRGYERYGAAAYFDAKFNLIGVYTCSSGQYHSCPSSLMAWLDQDIPGNGNEPDLESIEFSEYRHAMWAWRVSGLALVTVADHLVNVHMIAANALVKASRTNLPIHHPLRSFLKIFTFRTIGINSKAYRTLIRPKGVVNRNWAFEEDDLQDLLENTPNTFQKNFKDYIPASMQSVEEFPVNQDLTEFCEAVTNLVRRYLLLVYESPGDKAAQKRRVQRNVNNDAALQDFLGGLATELGLVQSRDLSSFEDVVYVICCFWSLPYTLRNGLSLNWLGHSHISSVVVVVSSAMF